MATASVTHGPIIRIEGAFGANAASLLKRTGAFERDGAWFCLPHEWPRIRTALRAVSVTITEEGDAAPEAAPAAPLEPAGARQVLLSVEEGRIRIQGSLPKPMRKDWLGSDRRNGHVGMTPWAIPDFLAACKEQGIEVTTDPSFDGLHKEVQERIAAVEHALTTTDLPDVPLATGTLRDYQRRAILFLQACGGRALIGADVGIGKTIEAIGYKRASGAQRILVVCPSTVKGNWADEIRKFDGSASTILDGFHDGRGAASLRTPWVITGFDTLLSRKGGLAGWLDTFKAWQPDLVVVDESHYCFPASTRVLTERGWLSIRNIVRSEEPIRALSMDSSRNEVEWKSVTARFRNPPPVALVKVSHEIGEIVCTPTHRIWTAEGYKEAQSLVAGNELRVLRSTAAAATSSPTVLQPLVLCQMETDAAQSSPTHSREPTQERSNAHGHQEAGCVGAHETAQRGPHVPAQGGRGHSASLGRESDFPFAGRERHGDEAPTGALSGTPFAGGVDGILHSDQDQEGRVRATSTCLQSGLGLSAPENRNRGGWPQPSHEEVEVPRPAQDGTPGTARVVRVEVLERRDYERHGYCPDEDSAVYDIEVEGNHNYFADGVLVSNCKSRESLRGQAIAALGLAVPHIPLMSGTLMSNSPMDYWNQLNAVQPGFWGTWFEFGLAWCNAQERTRYFGKGQKTTYWDTSGASNPESLKRYMRYARILQPKQEVAPELPEQIRIPRTMELLPGFRLEYEGIQKDHREMMAKLRGTMKEPDLDDPSKDDIFLASQRGKIMAMMLRLRQISGKGRIDGTVDLVLDLIENGKRPVVFAYFKESLHRLRDGLAEKGLRVAYIDGDVTRPQRDAIRQDFVAGKYQVLVGQTEAAGVGINLHEASDTTVTHELTYRPIDVIQTEGRVHRLGIVNPTNHYYCLGARTLDGHILDALQRKIAAKEAIDGNVEDDVIRSFFSRKGSL